MFDIGFGEIALVAIIALLVVGPKELPALMRTLGTWVGRVRATVNDFKKELDREVIRADQIERLRGRESELAELHKLLDETKATIPIDAETRSRPGPGAAGDQGRDPDAALPAEPGGDEAGGRQARDPTQGPGPAGGG